MKNCLATLIVALAMLALSATARAYINPNFTPKDLEKDSELILLLELKDAADTGEAVASVKKVLKGDCQDKELTFDLLAMSEPLQAQGKEVMATIAAGHREALLFAGRFRAEGTGLEGGGERVAGLLHNGGRWCVMGLADDNKIWEMEKIDEKMLGTFSGSSDMLVRCMTYIMTDPNAEVPVEEKADWAGKIQIGKTDRKINMLAAVDLAGDGKLAAFLASDAGDLVYRWNGKTMEDATAKLALQSRSAVFAWGDFNRDGKLDLASWDGKELSIHSQKPDGTFAAAAVKAGDALQDGCLSLSVLDVGRSGSPGLLIGTKAAPLVLTLKEDGSAECRPLVTGDFPQNLGAAGRCLVADFDGDSFPDVIQLFSRGGLFYKGQAPGAFAPPVKNQAGFGKPRYSACLGDYDHDGLPDILVVSQDGVPSLYQNLGGGKFANVLSNSGSFGYISKSGGTCCQTIDINNDGRQDIVVTYGAGLAPQIFFNRGFRCFGLARKMDAQVQCLLPQAVQGQQAGCVADFTGHNAMDMFLVLTNGELWLLPRRVEETALGVVATLSTKSPCAGPLLVTAFDQNKRPLGGWTVCAGEPGALFGMSEPGPLTLKWRLPGAQVQEKEVVVEDKAKRLYLDKQ